MKLTTTIEWHNLLKNPDDLPKSNGMYLVAFLYDGKIMIDRCDGAWDYIVSDGIFDCDDSEGGRIRSDDEVIVENCGQIAAWADYPMFYEMEAALNKEILDKDV